MNNKQGQLIIISAPAGTGKTTLVRMLENEFPDQIVQSISCTTRQPRPGEVDGKDYVFLTEEAFEKRIQKGEFLEYAKVFGFHYGTLKQTVEAQRNEGKDVVLVIDTQGALELKKKVPALFIFILPPSMEVLEERLKNRQTESPDTLKRRLTLAEHEIDQAKYYDYTIINDDLDEAYEKLRSIIVAKHCREGGTHGTS